MLRPVVSSWIWVASCFESDRPVQSGQCACQVVDVQTDRNLTALRKLLVSAVQTGLVARLPEGCRVGDKAVREHTALLSAQY